MVEGGEGVRSRSCQESHVGALGLQISRPIAGSLITLQLTGQRFWLAVPAGDCVAVLVPPPQDGTFIVDDRVSLLARDFTTTDARIGIRTPGKVAMVTAGGGTAWREGHNVPYFVAAIGIPYLDGVPNRFGVHVEYYWVRVTSDRFRRTFLNGQMVGEESLGEVHQWSHALTVGLRLGIPL